MPKFVALEDVSRIDHVGHVFHPCRCYMHEHVKVCRVDSLLAYYKKDYMEDYQGLHGGRKDYRGLHLCVKDFLES